MGSSPLTRGKPVAGLAHEHTRGLIPAHAGKTGCRRSERGRRRAHPRSRGENEIEALLDPEQQGSSPLTRGKRLLPCVGSWARGLIPAHAGKTSASTLIRMIARAHPRSRGENNWALWATRTTTGSSPLTRGKQSKKGLSVMNQGLIPAHAGKTRIHRPGSTGTGAHPRSRGENGTRSDLAYVMEGSSPLTRGKHGRGR